MLTITNEFKPIPDEIKLSSLYMNYYFPKNNDNVNNNISLENIVLDNDDIIIKNKNIDISSLNKIPLGILALGIGTVVYTVATGITIAIGGFVYGTTISVHAIANLGGLTNMYRHSKYIAAFVNKNSSKKMLLNKELPKEHLDAFATPYVYYKIMKSIDEFNNLSESNQLLIVKYVKENKNYDYSDIRNNKEISQLYTRIFFNYNSNSLFLDDLFHCNMENIKHSTIESQFISTYFKFLINEHIIIE